jgi:hypothetical protein
VIPSTLKKVIVSAVSNPRSAWCIVRNGAVAEFSVSAAIDTLRYYFDPESNLLFADTQKATLRLILDDSIKPVVAETAAYRCSPWSQCVYLCVEQEDAYMSCRNSLTHIESNGEKQAGEVWDLNQLA